MVTSSLLVCRFSFCVTFASQEHKDAFIHWLDEARRVFKQPDNTHMLSRGHRLHPTQSDYLMYMYPKELEGLGYAYGLGFFVPSLYCEQRQSIVTP